MAKLEPTPIYNKLTQEYGIYPVTLAFSFYPEISPYYEKYFLAHHQIISTSQFIPSITFHEYPI